MAWQKIQDNLRRASTGASMSSFVRKIGSSRTTFSRSAALEKSQPNSALRTQRYCSGCASMEFSVGQYRKREDSSIGACLAQITPCGTALENSIRAGLAASPLNGKPFMQAKSGSRYAARCGSETRRHASGADLFATQTSASRSTSITSHPLRSRRYERRRRTCCLFASLATNGFIQEGM